MWLPLRLHIVQLGEDLRQDDADGGAGDDELGFYTRLRATGQHYPCLTANRIKQPQMLDAHPCVIVEPLLYTLHSVIG